MGIPRKFTSKGFALIPFDILPFGEERPFPNMYWYFGQQDMKAAEFLKGEENLYAAYISNFACAPDSFLLHYLRWIMGTRPFLVLELDSHTADAGVDTRVEAFLDIIDGYRRKVGHSLVERYDNGLRFVNEGSDLHIRDERTGERIPIRNNPRVRLLLANMGDLGANLLAATLRCAGWSATALPVPDSRTLAFARRHVSGKECLPSHLVLGSALQFFASPEYRGDELYLVFVPETTGPCRTGQYAVFYENLFRDLRLENVVIMRLGSDQSYNELGASFTRHAWWGLALADFMKDAETVLRACAADPAGALARFKGLYDGLIRIAQADITGVIPYLEKMAVDLSGIELKRRPADCPRVLVVGEIYVRRDDFAVDELVEMFSRKGIIAKISGVTEWVYYCDFAQAYELKKRLSLLPLLKRTLAPEFRELAAWYVRQAYKHHVMRTIARALAPSGLLVESPHDMDAMIERARSEFVSLELESEVTISSGASATAMSDGYSGIVNISPFACLIGRVIEGVLAPWAREHRHPMISVEIDGNLLAPTTISKLEIFMLNVLRYRRTASMAELVEPPPPSGGEPALNGRKPRAVTGAHTA